MRIHVTKPLFAWDCLEDSPTLKTLQQLLDTLPDEKLLASLESARGRGRNDYLSRPRFLAMPRAGDRPAAPDHGAHAR